MALIAISAAAIPVVSLLLAAVARLEDALDA